MEEPKMTARQKSQNEPELRQPQGARFTALILGEGETTFQSAEDQVTYPENEANFEQFMLSTTPHISMGLGGADINNLSWENYQDPGHSMIGADGTRVHQGWQDSQGLGTLNSSNGSSFHLAEPPVGRGPSSNSARSNDRRSSISSIIPMGLCPQGARDTEVKVSRLYDLHVAVYHNLLESSAGGSGKEPPGITTSFEDLYKFTMTFSEIIRSCCPQYEAKSPEGSVENSSHQSRASLLLGNEGESGPEIDPAIIFLSLSCYHRLMILYQNLISSVHGKLLEATTGCSLIQSEKPSSAMELVQTVSSVGHLADRASELVNLLTASRSHKLHSGLDRMSQSYSLESNILHDIIGGPAKQICEQRKHLVDSIQRMSSLIGQSSLL
ncbi:hypothetical protein G7Y89_g4086 [Cudoniella acicularis]|uniref:Uncharacterized protein n=1 Tax=Cudoniella acicularis TaxID=354080 RepID=A0A8H4RQ57_9HELO|nr:hypothetical protein G7Y89_g4086 [Cudoniella acicularis]